MTTDGFKARSGCFDCAVCGRKTRVTSKHSHDGSEMCSECDEISMIENGISDYGDADGSLRLRIEQLTRAAIAKGGNIVETMEGDK